MALVLEKARMAIRKLAKGDTCTAVVRAREYWNPTGVEVGYLESYAIEAAGTWEDWGRSTDADGVADGLLQDLLSAAKRCPEAQWFQLVGSVGASEERLFPLGTFAHWTNRTFGAGELFLFANDAPGFYWNNDGELTVRITRIS